jgi:LacI family transcriptional regulator
MKPAPAAPRRQPGLKQIAELAGVSMMTVSRALRGEATVAPDTARKILDLATSVRYRRNKLVHGLRTGRTDLVAAMLPASLGFYEEALRSIEHALDEQGCSLILNMVPGDYGRDAMREEIRRIHRCIELRVDGIILRPVNDDANAVYFNEAIERRIPMVVIDRRLPDFSSDFVGNDDFAGGEAAARVLIARGCRSLAVLHAGDKVSTSRERKNGFLKAAAEAGRSTALLDCGDFYVTRESIAEKLQRIPFRDIDGIFAIGDDLAAQAIDVWEAHGRHCPRDVKIVGFGNLNTAVPGGRRIASFNQHADQIGVEAVSLLMQRIENHHRPFRSILLPADFVEGDTV